MPQPGAGTAANRGWAAQHQTKPNQILWPAARAARVWGSLRRAARSIISPAAQLHPAPALKPERAGDTSSLNTF